MNTATLDARGSAVIHLDGDTYRVSAKSVDDARVQIIQTVFDNVTTFPCQLMIDEADESRTVPRERGASATPRKENVPRLRGIPTPDAGVSEVSYAICVQGVRM